MTRTMLTSRVLLGAAAWSLGCSEPLAPDDVLGVYVRPVHELALAPASRPGDLYEYRLIADSVKLTTSRDGEEVRVFSRRHVLDGTTSAVVLRTPFRYELSDATIRPSVVCAGWCTTSSVPPPYRLIGDALLVQGEGSRAYRRVSHAAR